MSEEKTVRYIVTNHQNQPMELHLLSRVAILEPRGETLVEEAELVSPQLQVFLRNRQVTSCLVEEPNISDVTTLQEAAIDTTPDTAIEDINMPNHLVDLPATKRSTQPKKAEA